MKTKRKYVKPEFKSIKIDNQISMVMMSPTPPEEHVNMQLSNTVDPYKISKA